MPSRSVSDPGWGKFKLSVASLLALGEPDSFADANGACLFAGWLLEAVVITRNEKQS